MRTTIPDFWKRLKEIDMFFQGKSPVHKTMKRVVKQLDKAKIPYAVIGAMAVNAHGHERTTNDVDLLVTAEGLAEFKRRYVPEKYEPTERRSRRFTDRTNRVMIDFLLTGHFPGFRGPGPITFPDPRTVTEIIKDIHVVNLPTLIQLKLASRRHKDFGDVVELIRVHKLDESFLPNLHAKVRRDYIECLEEKRREDEYEEREG